MPEIDAIIYKCPRGCTYRGRPKIFNSLRGWKKHMTWEHEGYREAELSAVAAETVGVPTDGLSFDEVAASLGETETGSPPPPGPTPATEKPKEEKRAQVKTGAAAKALAEKMSKLKRQVAEALPKAFDTFLKSKGPGWAMDDEQRSLLSDAVESVFEILDIQFSIAQFNVELKSRLWVLLYPVAAALMILGIKTAQNAPKIEDTETVEEHAA